ncbi:ferric uptake regulator, Fur family [Chloroherpeton thalassium ATCC 35110]|uniref:Ferric uptake regulation protein n=1 Tax=Chloroherpeton thalassium (strain ATCC 35110 / GB-78) TaxID=517418 RepID=B3QUX9_CHLT3|nr:transcriptional repressor [Chloroherpeton thalassium]ACF14480.1 ferric uptake regulator, Fur family [Chloroherpeton thalassium ATCC 35110]
MQTASKNTNTKISSNQGKPKKKSTDAEGKELKILQEVEDIFQNYLRKKGHRSTPERLKVLQEIYTSSEHLDADQIFLNLKQKGANISRATVYNTLDLLVECSLVSQNSFGHKHLHYERSYGYKTHHHIICEKCGRVLEFTSPEIDEELRQICEFHGFKLKRNNLQLFGECIYDECDHLEKRKSEDTPK